MCDLKWTPGVKELNKNELAAGLFFTTQKNYDVQFKKERN